MNGAWPFAHRLGGTRNTGREQREETGKIEGIQAFSNRLSGTKRNNSVPLNIEYHTSVPFATLLFHFVIQIIR